MPSSGLLEGLTLFTENTGLIVGRTLFDPSRWKVPVIVSNFSQETIVVDPFTEVGMITKVTAIQCVTEPLQQQHSSTGALPRHFQDLLEQTCRDLDPAQLRRLAAVLLKYSDIFPVPGAPLTGHTDAVEHDNNTGDRPPISCAPRRMSPQKKKTEEECVAEMLTGGQIKPSDSPWSSPVVLVTKKDGGICFCVDYRRLNDVTTKDVYPSLGLTISSICWPVSSGFLPSTWPVAIGRCHCPRRPVLKMRSQHIWTYFSFGSCHLASVMPQRPLSG